MRTTVKIPKHISVGGHTYSITHKPLLSKENGIRGHIVHNRQIIQIEPENPLTQRNVTLLHEAIHLVDAIFSLDLSESDTNGLAEGLYQILSDSFGIDFDWGDVPNE